MRPFTLIRSGQGTAEYNMALDEKILHQYLEDRIPVLRVYQWKGPSFTHGFSQVPAELLDLAQCEAAGVGVAARMTGGGVLFHHDEITYSFVCDKSDIGEPHDVFVSYRQICAFLLRFYSSCGLKASFARDTAGFQEHGAPCELCCAAHEKFDMVIGGRKIGGNAQKRKRQVVFQHGSIPCSIDWEYTRRCVKSVPEGLASGVTTLSQEMAHVPDKSRLEDVLIEAFAREFNVEFTHAGVCDEASVA